MSSKASTSKHTGLTGNFKEDFPELDLAVGAQLAVVYAGIEAQMKKDNRIVGPILEANAGLVRKLVGEAEDRYRRAISGGQFKEDSDFGHAEDIDDIKTVILRAMMKDLADLLIKAGVNPATLSDLAQGLASEEH